MSSMMKARVLTVVMLLLGILMVVGSTMSIFSTSVFPFDGLAGTDASVAGVAFGGGRRVPLVQPGTPRHLGPRRDPLLGPGGRLPGHLRPLLGHLGSARTAP